MVGGARAVGRGAGRRGTGSAGGLGGYLARRLGASALLLLLVLTLTFALLHAAPGSPADQLVTPGPGMAERQARLERTLGLDRPLHEQYAAWLGAAARGDWGTSLFQGRPVSRMIAEALPATALLALAALFVEYVFALALGVWSARRRDRFADHAIRAVSLLLFSIPTFWLGLMAILVLAHLWPVFPAGNMTSAGAEGWGAAARLADLARHLALPALVLGLGTGGATVRFVRDSLLDVLGEDFVRTARAKGLSERRVVGVHALRNALAPLFQLLGLSLPALLNGSLVVEVVFAWPGLGRLIFQAINARDLPVVLATTAVGGALVLGGSLLADLLHAAADPRVRHRREARAGV